MALDLANRDGIKTIIDDVRKSYAGEKNISVPQKLVQKGAGLLTSLKDAGAEIEEAELREKLTSALDSASGGSHFVHAGKALQELDTWLAPFRPAPPVEEEPSEEGDAE